jgi:hypothetical protein
LNGRSGTEIFIYWRQAAGKKDTGPWFDQIFGRFLARGAKKQQKIFPTEKNLQKITQNPGR